MWKEFEPRFTGLVKHGSNPLWTPDGIRTEVNAPVNRFQKPIRGGRLTVRNPLSEYDARETTAPGSIHP